MTGSHVRWDPSTVLLLAATIAVISVGQILFKLASSGVSLAEPRSFVSFHFLVALAVYGAATLMWLLVLSRLPLSIAFPFYGITFLLVPLLASIYLGETLRAQSIIGGMVILVGIWISVRGSL